MKKLFCIVMSICMVLTLLTGCGGSEKQDAPVADDSAAADTLRVVLIGNQKFGDNGPMDDMAAGGERAAEEFGVEFKKIESEPASFEEDIRSLGEHFRYYKMLQRVELLPYHTLGMHKYETMGQEYPLKDTKTNTPEQIDRAKSLLDEYFDCVIVN